MKKPQSVSDLSAVVTGMLLAFVCPVTIPYWMILIGDFFAIVVVKQLFGGIGKNFVNPALAGRAALVASYAGTMTAWADPAGRPRRALGGGTADVVTAATPLAYMKTGDMDGLKPDQPRGGYVPGQDRRLPGRDLRPDADHRRRVPDLAQGHQLADSRGLHRHRGRADLPVPQGRRRHLS